jgi:hypothetical protein
MVQQTPAFRRCPNPQRAYTHKTLLDHSIHQTRQSMWTLGVVPVMIRAWAQCLLWLSSQPRVSPTSGEDPLGGNCLIVAPSVRATPRVPLCHPTSPIVPPHESHCVRVSLCHRLRPRAITRALRPVMSVPVMSPTAHPDAQTPVKVCPRPHARSRREHVVVSRDQVRERETHTGL